MSFAPFEVRSVLTTVAGFARVFLVRKVGGRDDGTLYAMKRVPKGSSRKAKRVRRERDVLDYIRYFPYVTNMHYAFGTEAAVYLVTGKWETFVCNDY